MTATMIDRRSILVASLLAAAAGGARAQGSSAKFKIGIIGSGHVGSTLGTLWAKAGHPVFFSSRHPDALKDLVAQLGPLARAGSVTEAAAFGDVLFIAVPYTALPQIGRDIKGSIAGKVVFDASNPIVPRDGAMAQEAIDKGAGAASADLLPGALVVRGFNAVGYKSVANESHRAGAPIAVPICADDPKAAAAGSDLVRDAGFVPIVLPLSRANDILPGGRAAGVWTERELKQKLGLAE